MAVHAWRVTKREMIEPVMKQKIRKMVNSGEEDSKLKRRTRQTERN